MSAQATKKAGSTLEELAHDLRQPLGTIESLAYYLEITCSDEERRVHLRRIQDMVVEANRILNQATALKQVP